MTTPDIAEVARSLTKAQREAVVGATVCEPHPAMPSYWSIEMPDRGMNERESDELVTLGLVRLPIRTGGRSGPGVYHGEILPLGLAVRAYLMEQGNV